MYKNIYFYEVKHGSKHKNAEAKGIVYSMNWEKILTALKIPMKVLLPSVLLFSGFFILANEETLSALGMLQWKMDNSFVFGLLFLISTCLIIVYIFWFAKEKLSNCISQATFRIKVAKSLNSLNDAEAEIIMTLYKSEGYTNDLDFNNPIVQGLLARRFIYMGRTQLVALDWDNTVSAKFSLQPFVYQAMEHEIETLRKRINTITKKLTNIRKESKKQKLQDELSKLQQIWKNYEEFEV